MLGLCCMMPPVPPFTSSLFVYLYNTVFPSLQMFLTSKLWLVATIVYSHVAIHCPLRCPVIRCTLQLFTVLCFPHTSLMALSSIPLGTVLYIFTACCCWGQTTVGSFSCRPWSPFSRLHSARSTGRRQAAGDERRRRKSRSRGRSKRRQTAWWEESRWNRRRRRPAPATPTRWGTPSHCPVLQQH